MLAKRRSIKLNGKEIIQTPLLVPSFSSKGFPDVNLIIQFIDEILTDCYLVSAYDLHHGLVGKLKSIPELIFVDSGGYECSKDLEFSDLGLLPHDTKEWTSEMHLEALQKLDLAIPTVLISYDNPKHRLTIPEQIKNAELLHTGLNVVKEILLKPETKEQKYIQLDSILQNVHKLAVFDVIGFTEKELGNTLLKRMSNIAKIRAALSEANLDKPMHIFGSLDTISTPLYFLSGADIFDGLTWLRMAYREGYTMYMHNAAAYADGGAKLKDEHIKAHIITKNYYALQDLQSSMRRYLNDKNFHEFQYNSELFARIFQDLKADVGGS